MYYFNEYELNQELLPLEKEIWDARREADYCILALEDMLSGKVTDKKLTQYVKHIPALQYYFIQNKLSTESEVDLSNVKEDKNFILRFFAWIWNILKRVSLKVRNFAYKIFDQSEKLLMMAKSNHFAIKEYLKKNGDKDIADVILRALKSTTKGVPSKYREKRYKDDASKVLTRQLKHSELILFNHNKKEFDIQRMMDIVFTPIYHDIFNYLGLLAHNIMGHTTKQTHKDMKKDVIFTFSLFEDTLLNMLKDDTHKAVKQNSHIQDLLAECDDKNVTEIIGILYTDKNVARCLYKTKPESMSKEDGDKKDEEKDKKVSMANFALKYGTLKFSKVKFEEDYSDVKVSPSIKKLSDIDKYYDTFTRSINTIDNEYSRKGLDALESKFNLNVKNIEKLFKDKLEKDDKDGNKDGVSKWFVTNYMRLMLDVKTKGYIDRLRWSKSHLIIFNDLLLAIQRELDFGDEEKYGDKADGKDESKKDDNDDKDTKKDDNATTDKKDEDKKDEDKKD